MTWPPTRPVRKRLFGVVFLLVWALGMYLCWGWPVRGEWTEKEKRDSKSVVNEDGQQWVSFGTSLSVDEYRADHFGFASWLVGKRSRDGLSWNLAGDPPIVQMWIEPRGLTVGLIMTAVSSLILYVGWRATVGGFVGPCGVCDGCGYDLRTLNAARCPECGEQRR